MAERRRATVERARLDLGQVSGVGSPGMALVASEGGGCYLSVVCWLGYGLLLPAIAESSDRGGRRGADAGVEVVVKGPDGDVLGCELEPLPPSRICVWSTRLSRLRAPESRLRADRRCCRSGLVRVRVRGRCGHTHRRRDILVLREVEEVHQLRRSFGSLGRRPGGRTRPDRVGGVERRPAAPDSDRQDWSSGWPAPGRMTPRVAGGAAAGRATRTRAPATARWSAGPDGSLAQGSQVAWVRWSWVLARGWVRATAVTQPSRRGDW
jgi:hypothetical protein